MIVFGFSRIQSFLSNSIVCIGMSNMNSKVRTKRGSRRRGVVCRKWTRYQRGVKGNRCTRRGKGLSTVRRTGGCTRRTRGEGCRGRTVERRRGGAWGNTILPIESVKDSITNIWIFTIQKNNKFLNKGKRNIEIGFYFYDTWYVMQKKKKIYGTKLYGYPISECTLDSNMHSLSTTSNDIRTLYFNGTEKEWNNFKNYFNQLNTIVNQLNTIETLKMEISPIIDKIDLWPNRLILDDNRQNLMRAENIDNKIQSAKNIYSADDKFQELLDHDDEFQEQLDTMNTAYLITNAVNKWKKQDTLIKLTFEQFLKDFKNSYKHYLNSFTRYAEKIKEKNKSEDFVLTNAYHMIETIHKCNQLGVNDKPFKTQYRKQIQPYIDVILKVLKIHFDKLIESEDTMLIDNLIRDIIGPLNADAEMFATFKDSLPDSSLKLFNAAEAKAAA